MLSHVLRIRAFGVPVELASPEVLGLACLSHEALGEGTQDGLHHSQVLQVVVRLGRGEGRGEGRGGEEGGGGERRRTV